MPYTPSRPEQRKFARLLGRLTPSRAAFHRYQRSVATYCERCEFEQPAFSMHGTVGVGSHVTSYHSVLFGGDYLVVYVDTAWFRGFAPSCDAVASVMVDSPERPPPLVLVPEDRCGSRSERFRAILEHEFVHINQALLGTFREPPPIRSAHDLLDRHFARTRNEYEANFLQLVRWPSRYQLRSGLSLDHWCALRGHSQSLEESISSASRRNLPARVVGAYLDALPQRLSDELRRMDLSPTIVAWFIEQLSHHVKVAVSIVLEAAPSLAKAPAVRAIAAWLRARQDGMKLRDGIPAQRRSRRSS